jgi:hypothetical protein
MNFKDLENIIIEGVDIKDYPDFCDAFLSHADHNGAPLTEDELIKLQEDYPEEINELAYMSLID